MKRAVGTLIVVIALIAMCWSQDRTGGGQPGTFVNSQNTFTKPQTAPAFYPQSLTAGPYLNFFHDMILGAGWNAVNIGTPTGNAMAFGTGSDDLNHPGDMLLTSGTTSGSGQASQNGGAAFFVNANSSTLAWTYETEVNVAVLPGTTAASYQSGFANVATVNPWTTGIQFYLSSANASPNNWNCRFATTNIDSGVAAVAATWTRLTIVSDATKVHWYINGVEVCGTGTAVASMPSQQQRIAQAATALSTTSVNYDIDYILVLRNVNR